MQPNLYPTICTRCGLNLRPGGGVEVEGRAEHTYCHKRYAGTTVHYLFNPDPHSPSETYHHIRPDGGNDIYDVSGLKDAWGHIPTTRCSITMDVVQVNMIACEITEQDARDVEGIRRAKGTFDDPVLIVLDDHGNAMQTIDGNHRVVAKALSGVMEFDGILLTRHMVYHHVLRDVPEELLAKLTTGI